MDFIIDPYNDHFPVGLIAQLVEHYISIALIPCSQVCFLNVRNFLGGINPLVCIFNKITFQALKLGIYHILPFIIFETY